MTPRLIGCRVPWTPDLTKALLARSAAGTFTGAYTAPPPTSQEWKGEGLTRRVTKLFPLWVLSPTILNSSSAASLMLQDVAVRAARVGARGLLMSAMRWGSPRLHCQVVQEDLARVSRAGVPSIVWWEPWVRQVERPGGPRLRLVLDVARHEAHLPALAQDPWVRDRLSVLWMDNRTPLRLGLPLGAGDVGIAVFLQASRHWPQTPILLGQRDTPLQETLDWALLRAVDSHLDRTVEALTDQIARHGYGAPHRLG